VDADARARQSGTPEPRRDARPGGGARIEQIFARAVLLPPAERAAFLAAECSGDASLAAEVASLLAADDGARGFLETPALAAEPGGGGARGPVDASSAHPASGDLAGARVGAYRIVRLIGSGGMSSVYLAERDAAEHGFRMQVALKVIKRGLDTDEILRRFVTERRLLAGLVHPNIARLIDGGATNDGRPYIVMEYVDGTPIDRYCEARGLPVRERLALFRGVCAAVAHAHRSLVVHRDLKPSNIFVTEDGIPKLLDFGIAKVLETEIAGADAGGERVVATVTALRMMTPRYASPEQIRGEPTTTEPDVYSLGVVLYELLAGRSPFPSDTSLSDLERIICESAPARPSAAVRGAATTAGATARPAPAGDSPRRRARTLAGDLDMIVLMAMRKEPERRYGSVDQLDDDIRRHLQGLPVMARPDTVRYRTAKFLRRNPAPVAAAALIVVLLAAFGVAMSVQLGRTRAERDRANVEAETARSTSEFLEGLFRVSDPSEARGRSVTAREILERGAQRVEKDLAEQPLVQARLLRSIGGVYANLGLYGDAQPILERAVEIHRTAPDADETEVAASLDRLANLYRRTGDTKGSLALAEEALAIRERAFGADHINVASSLNNVALLRTRVGDLDGATALLARAIAIRERELGSEHPDLAAPLFSLANIHMERDGFRAARPLYERTLRIWEASLGPDHPQVAAALSSLSRIASEEDRHAAADSLARRALAIRSNVYGAEHDVVGGDLSNLALVRLRAGDARGALGPAEQAVAIIERALGSAHVTTAYAHLTFAEALAQVGEHARAAASYERVIAILDTDENRGDASLRKALREYAEMLRAGGGAANATNVARVATIEARLAELP